MAQKFITIKIWDDTRKEAKILAIHNNVTLARFVSDALKAYRYLLEKYGPEWKERI